MARTPREVSFRERLCAAYRNLAGASGAAVTAWYGEPHRVTLGVTDELSSGSRTCRTWCALRERAVMLDLDVAQVAQVALAIVTAAGDPRTR